MAGSAPPQERCGTHCAGNQSETYQALHDAKVRRVAGNQYACDHAGGEQYHADQQSHA
jgi:hypothetical protein